jgi:hypothetical protein
MVWLLFRCVFARGGGKQKASVPIKIGTKAYFFVISPSAEEPARHTADR